MTDRAGKLARAAAVIGLMAGLFALGHAFDLRALLDVDHVHALVSSAGAWGALTFVALFVASVLVQVPGFVFVVAAPALFPWLTAWLLCLLASNIAVLINFEVVRRIGGQPLANTERPWLRKLFAGLDARPVRTVAVLRLVTIMFPPVTGALALTSVGARDHAVGSALGMVLPVTAILALASWFLG